MIYPFVCPKCGYYTEIVAHHTEMPETAKCDECGGEMNRKFTVPQVTIPKVGYFDHGLGVYVNSKSDIKAAIKNIKDTTGREIEEVGNENYKPPQKSSEQKWDEHIKELARGGAFDNISDNEKLNVTGGQ